MTSQAELHAGPITALISLRLRSLPIATSPCFGLQPESAQLYSSTRPGNSEVSALTSSTASAAAPAILGPTLQDPVTGIKRAK